MEVLWLGRKDADQEACLHVLDGVQLVAAQMARNLGITFDLLSMILIYFLFYFILFYYIILILIYGGTGYKSSTPGVFPSSPS